MNRSALIFATLVGTAAQVAMVVIGHFVPAVRGVYMAGGLGLSLLAGLLYAWKARAGWGDALIGGLIAGGVCAVIGIAVSWLLKDAPVSLIALGGGSSAVTGLIGGAVGRLIVRPSAPAT